MKYNRHRREIRGVLAEFAGQASGRKILALPVLGANTALAAVFFPSPGVYACGMEGCNPISFSFRPRSRGRGCWRRSPRIQKSHRLKAAKRERRGWSFLRPRRKTPGLEKRRPFLAFCAQRGIGKTLCGATQIILPQSGGGEGKNRPTTPALPTRAPAANGCPRNPLPYRPAPPCAATMSSQRHPLGWQLYCHPCFYRDCWGGSTTATPAISFG